MSFEAITQIVKAKKPEKPEKTQDELRQVLSERKEKMRQNTENQLDIYVEKLDKGEFDDQEGEPVGSGEKRKEQMQKELLRVANQIEKIQETLDSGEELPQEAVNIDVVKTQNEAFLEGVFGEPANKFVPSLTKPEDLDYAILKNDVDSTKFGEYTLNPDTQNLDFENIPESKILIPDLSAFVGKSLSEVAKHLVDTYSDTHYLPGVEYWKWLCENPAKSPAKLKDGNYYFNFGSLVRGSGGLWCVPYARWFGSGWNRAAARLGSTWSSGCRVVLLEI